MEARGAGLRETMAHLDAGALTPEQFAVERQERLLQGLQEENDTLATRLHK